jgi:signal transduction histidine kinase
MGKRLIYIVFLLLLSSTSSIHGEKRSTLPKDTNMLKKELSKRQGASRLAILEALGSEDWNTPQQEMWLKKCYEESIRLDSFEVADRALSSLACYYHNNSMSKQLQQCSSKIDMVVKKMGRLTDGYFIVQAFNCQRDLWDEKYNEVIYKARTLYKQALRVDSKIGQIHFEELMGLIYQFMGRDKDAYPYIKTALTKQNKYYSDDYARKTQLLTTLIEVCLRTEHLGEVKQYLREIEKIQFDVRKGIYGPALSFPIQRNFRLISAYYMDYYLRTNNLSMVKRYKDKAFSIKQSDVYVDFYVNYETALYFKAIKDYSQALKYINLVIKADGESTIEYIMLRGDIYAQMGKLGEAIADYKLCIEKQQKYADTNFDQQVAYLQNSHNTMQLQLNLKKSELKAQQLKNRNLIGTIIFLLLAIAIFVPLFIRNNRLRKLLAKDKEQLISSEKILKTALSKAGEVDKMKNTFLHNISHEIRTPLNAIVGFSDLITNKYHDDKECLEYNKAIKENNDSLLNLVNNLIDLSVYLSNDHEEDALQLEKCNLSVLCQEIINKIKQCGLLRKGVELSFSGTPEAFILNTDKKRLTQIITNLLKNAAQHTVQGSINLDYQLQENKHIIIFAVTDTGVGIDSNLRINIFDYFEKGNEFKLGMGIGLPICRLLTERFHGKIYLDPNYTKGSRFVFTHATDL